MPTAPYGSWKSPITADLIISSSVGISQPCADDGALYWVESRPTEGGRNAIVRRDADGATEDLIPPPYNARTRVHEYGGADYLVDGDTLYFANFQDQRVYVVTRAGEPRALTSATDHRYAAFVMDRARNRLICVREDHSRVEEDDPASQPENTIAAIDLGSGEETVLAEGHDFFAYPSLSPDGASLAWVAWDHPNMPWDTTTLYLARLDAAGRPAEPRTERAGSLMRDAAIIQDGASSRAAMQWPIAGGDSESVLQPHWSPDGRLYFVSDRSGYWLIYRHDAASGEAMAQHVRDNDFAQPPWQLGAQTYDFDGPGHIVATYCHRGLWRLARVDTTTGALDDIETPFTMVRDLTVADGRAIFVAGAPDRPTALVALDLASGEIDTIKRASSLEIDPGYVSVPQSIEFPTTAGLTAHAFYYPARNSDYEDPSPAARPPLLVMSHGGPTGQTAAVLSPRILYWTSRGVAVLDVNYGGSTGFGRAYRQRLNGAWGIVDVDDCVNAARYLVERGDVDPERLAITGGSAGGYTTLAALAFRDTFKAGASHYGVADLEALAIDTHKFESRYLDSLIGPYPEDRETYVQRSPIHSAETLTCPIIFFQGLEDRIVPPNQAEAMVAALREKGIPVAYFPFEGEQHGFRRAENIKRSFEAELLFYGRVFGFAPADPIDPFEIHNL